MVPHRTRLFLTFIVALTALACPAAAKEATNVYVVLWFDTEDYLLPASDDAALRLAKFLSEQKVRATFKVVGEKARTLKGRERYDVIEALKKHEIGYHSNWHSVQPSPAMYCSPLGWDEGVEEFDRREGGGRADVEKIFGQEPSCYGQPGSSWTPQSFGAMRRWGMPVYLDAGSHVGLDGKPHYYCGVLTLYRLAHTLRTGLESESDLRAAEDRFQNARAALAEQGGGVVSIFYHPCEFVHKQFWDGVNFARGANPPREKWKLPPQKTPAESAVAWKNFESYIRFIRGFDDVRFITASEAAKLYGDRAIGREFTPADVKAVAQRVADEVSFQRHDGYSLSASEIFALLVRYVAGYRDTDRPALTLDASPLGPTGETTALTETLTVDWSQFERTASDVADYFTRHQRVPSAVWLGSRSVPPESYLLALAEVAAALAAGSPPPESVAVKPARLAASQYVAEDGPQLWGWVIFPPGFRALAMMQLAKRQAWTIKPALLLPDSQQ